MRTNRPIGLAVAALGIVAAGAAELKNTSFEEPGHPARQNSTEAAGWTCEGPWLRRETGWAPRHWGRCMIGYHHWRVTEAVPSVFHQDISDVAPGTAVSFGLFAFKDQATNAEAVELRIEPAGGGKPLAARIYPLREWPSGAWTKLSVSATNRSHSSVRLAVVVRPATGAPRDGSIKFDDASLDLVAPQGVKP